MNKNTVGLILSMRPIKRSDYNNLLLLLRELLQYFREANVSINYQSRPVILFLGTLVSLLGLGVALALRSLHHTIQRYKDKRVASRPNLSRQSSTTLTDRSRVILVPKARGNPYEVVIPRPNNDMYAADKYLFKNFESERKHRNEHSLLDSKFLDQLVIIWRILVPKFYSKNTVFIMAQCFFLVLRTWLSLLVAKLDGQIVQNLIGANGRKFSRDLIYWLLIAFPASYTNAAIKYLTDRLSLNFRTNLIRYVHDIYLDKVMAYYKVAYDDSQIENIDQYITNDITKFCDSICGLFSSMGKPFIDLVFFAVYLRDNLGTGAIIGIFANYFATAFMLKRFTPPFGRLKTYRTKLEGKYYNQHLALISNSEEIGFYKGSSTEKRKLNTTFEKLISHCKKEINISMPYSCLEDYILKYTWSAWGYIFAGLPVFIEDFKKYFLSRTDNREEIPYKKPDEKKNMRQFVVNKRLMLSLADAGSRLMYSIKDISELTGYTERVFDLLYKLHAAHSPRFAFGSVLGDDDIKGTIQKNYHDGFRFENASVIVPTSKGSQNPPLVKSLSLNLPCKLNLLILGSNGCGKTSIARIMAQLWPLYLGLLSRPNDADIFFLPQKSYFTNGTLGDQIIYPHSYDDMMAMGYNDDYLYKILCDVKLEYLLKREGHFGVRKEWKDVLSGGEKQRMSFARVLFKRPHFAILDESTSAVSADVEDALFFLLKRKGITYITLSHRPLLMQYHDYVLEFKADSANADSEPNWVFHDLTSEENLNSLDKEIKEIETKLYQVEKWEARLKEVESYLDGKNDSISEPHD